MKNTGHWQLQPMEKGTKVSLMMDYELPYSILGMIIDKLKVEKEFTSVIDEALESAKQILEN